MASQNVRKRRSGTTYGVVLLPATIKDASRPVAGALLCDTMKNSERWRFEKDGKYIFGVIIRVMISGFDTLLLHGPATQGCRVWVGFCSDKSNG
eukprot:scaffold193_cov90-Cylindrotheca_fusiformis.AAC.1